MFIRQYFRKEKGRRIAYWALVESYRSASGPRQRIVAWLGKIDEAGRLGVQQAVDGVGKLIDSSSQEKGPVTLEAFQPIGRQMRFEFDDDASATQPRWVEVNTAGVRVENLRQFGGPWLAMHLIRTLQLDSFLERTIPDGRERVGWDISSLILMIARLLEPSSELHTAEQWYPKTAFPDLLGVPEECLDENRLYRAMDVLLLHKEALECHLKDRLGTLIGLERCSISSTTCCYTISPARILKARPTSNLRSEVTRVTSGVIANKSVLAWLFRGVVCHWATRFSRGIPSM